MSASTTCDNCDEIIDASNPKAEDWFKISEAYGQYDICSVKCGQKLLATLGDRRTKVDQEIASWQAEKDRGEFLDERIAERALDERLAAL